MSMVPLIFSFCLGAINASPNAKIQGVATVVSRIIKIKKYNYFDGELADDMARVRLFGFNNDVRKKLLEHQQHKDSVVIGKCEVKHARKGGLLEVMLAAKQTEIE